MSEAVEVFFKQRSLKKFKHKLTTEIHIIKWLNEQSARELTNRAKTFITNEYNYKQLSQDRKF